MSNLIRIKRGLNLQLIGSADGEVAQLPHSPTDFAIIPDDFKGIKPKLLKKEGEAVCCGEAIFCDKNNPAIMVASPISGTLSKIERGERRKIERITLKAGKEEKRVHFDVGGNLQPEQIRQILLSSGVWAFMRQRPYGIVPDPAKMPRDIFISLFDSAPLSQGTSILAKHNSSLLKKGVETLAKLTTGKVYVGCREYEKLEIPMAETIIVEGPHPAGNVGVQIANVRPINKGETVWALDAETVVRIGGLFTNGYVDFTCAVAITGERVKNPSFVYTTIGVALRELLEGNIDHPESSRIISGNVLTGKLADMDGFLRYPYRQVTVIPENNHPDEFMGWASLSRKKYSAGRTFFSWLARKSKKYHFDAKLNGSERAIIMTGEYDKVFPFDIYAEFLIKAIIAKDIDKMEQLGIYEVDPEDFALCEFIDTSKLELQKIVSEGLEYLRTEMN